MKFFPLIWGGLRRRPLRSILTMLAVAVAFVLYGLLYGVLAGFDDALDKMSDTRLRVLNRSSIFAPLPLAYQARIAGMAGVERVTHVTLFGGYFQEPRNSFSSAAVGQTFPMVFDELKIPADQLEAWQRTRTGAIVGAALAERYGWKLGDRVPLKSLFWVNADGSQNWTFDVVALANAGPEDDEVFAQELYFHYDYLDQARQVRNGTVHQFAVAIDHPGNAAAIADAIDAGFENSTYATATQSERLFVVAQIQQVGDVRLFVNAIVGAVMFTLLFLTGSTMMQSVRDRFVELGVLKALGFTDAMVFATVVLESLVLCLAAAVLGLAVTAAVFPGLFDALGVGAVPLPPSVWLSGLGTATALALLVAIWPAWRARTLSIAEVLGGRK